MPRRELSFDRTIEIVFWTVVFSAACLVPFQSDTWWHLRAGKEMWSRQFVMLTDEFSFVANGRYWPNHEWLGDVLLYAAYRVGGLPGMTVLAAVCVTAATAMAWRLMRGAATVRLLLMALAMPSLVLVWTVRPLVFTLLLLMVVLRLVVKSVYWAVPVVIAVWANVHGGVALAFVVLGGAAVADVWMSARNRTGTAAFSKSWLSPFLPWAALIAVSFLATLLTPLGLHLWTTIPESVHKSVANGIQEWRPATLGWRDAAFWCVAVALLVTTAARARSIDTREHAVLTAVSLALLPLAIRYSRNITPFLLVAIPALNRSLPGLWRVSSRDGERPDRSRLNWMLAAAVAGACGIAVALAWSKPAERLKWHPMSAGIIRAVEACPGRLYNRYDDGGYLIWFVPGVRVFVDSRQDPYPLDFLQEHLHSETSGRFEPVFERYRIHCAFLPPSSPTAPRLREAGWQVSAADARWVVLEAPITARRSESAPGAPSRPSD
jgi:hypothetical protein